MKYNLSLASEKRRYDNKSDFFKSKGKTVDLKEVKQTRSNDQNSSLHLFFTMISEQLNELGMEYRFFGVTGVVISLRYTDELVKKFFWKEIQKALFDFESTTKLNTEQLNQIIDVIVKFFGDRGVVIEFPSKESLDNNNFDN